MGVAEDTSDASIACRQVGPIKVLAEFKDCDRVFGEHRSLVFKALQVVRFFDRELDSLYASDGHSSIFSADEKRIGNRPFDHLWPTLPENPQIVPTSRRKAAL